MQAEKKEKKNVSAVIGSPDRHAKLLLLVVLNTYNVYIHVAANFLNYFYIT